MNPIHVIGIGQGRQDLTARHLEIIQEANVLAGGRQQVALFPEFEGEVLLIDRHIDAFIQQLKERIPDRRVVVLGSGDPLFHGIGTTLLAHFDKSLLRFHGNVSSVAAAFAAIKEPWHDAEIISLHNRKLPPFSFARLARINKAVFLTRPSADPAHIARQLMNHQLFDFRLCVLEHLGNPEKETIAWFEHPQEILNRSFSHPNVMVLLKKGTDDSADVSHETHTGMADERFSHARGLITKSEIRSITLSRLKLTNRDHVLWDIGAGSGSVSIEAALAMPESRVIAIEKNRDRIPDITGNIKRFHCDNVQVAHLAVPENTATLPRPDRIFVGGGGRHLSAILEAACKSLLPSGILVINAVLIQNVTTAFTCLANHQFNPEMIQVQISRARSMPYGTRMEPLNPVWIISGTKPNDNDKDTTV
jgi:precorrin-6Y C5,15-methyltransferase (decarboxylating)